MNGLSPELLKKIKYVIKYIGNEESCIITRHPDGSISSAIEGVSRWAF